MEQKLSLLRNIVAYVLFFGILATVIRFAYVVTTIGESCNLYNFCFFKNNVVPQSNPHNHLYASREWDKAVHFYSSIFEDMISKGYLSPHSKSLCVEAPNGHEVFALKKIGVEDSIGIFRKAAKPLVIRGEDDRIPFDDNTFDFIFSGGARVEMSARPFDFASEIVRALKPQGFAVFHVKANDTYSLNSFLDLFHSCKLIKVLDIHGFNPSMPYIREIVLKKANHGYRKIPGDDSKNCSFQAHKQELVQKAEPLIEEEPLKPWITLKRNIKNVKYFSSMVDISFKNRYVYIDVGARNYGSSIGSWFMKQYPKQGKSFHVYAIEADKAFHKQYASKKKAVTLLPYAAWVRNETLSFEINDGPAQEKVNKTKNKGRGMGRIQPVKSSRGEFNSEVNEIQGFDFAEWLKNTFTKRDFVVIKMDVEGTEFDLIPKLFETGAICLIDEIFLECHYNRWQRCCPGQRSTKYKKHYRHCLELFTSLRKNGVLVHQWW
ncbi:hypothetical protein Gotur_023059 [Gossypium turneri]